MDPPEWYKRPLVAEIADIFGHPKPVEIVTEKQFDYGQDRLQVLARSPWHEMETRRDSFYLMDLAYCGLQQDLFDYAFPGFLIRWWEGLVAQASAAHGETDIYFAIWHGQVFNKMMPLERRTRVMEWMTRAFIDALDAWSGWTTWQYSEGTNHHFLWTFNSLGRTLPVTPSLWKQMSNVSTPGRAQFWILIGTGLAYPTNEVPWIPPWTPDGGGGGVYIEESDDQIYTAGYLSENVDFLRQELTLESLRQRIEEGLQLVLDDQGRLASEDILLRLRTSPDYMLRKLQWLNRRLGIPDLDAEADEPMN